jgi:5-methylcytosine-specific restriction endonuclease McrA
MSSIKKSTEDLIWEEADYRCANPVCRKSRFEAALQIHHIIPREDGGDDSADNLILLCSNCHGLYHLNNAFSQKQFFSWKRKLKKNR